jgi:hypothetical protein
MAALVEFLPEYEQITAEAAYLIDKYLGGTP